MATQHRPFERSRSWGASAFPLLLIGATILVGVAGLLPLVHSSGVTTTGGRIWQLEQERNDWHTRLQEQEIEVARLGSLERIDREARQRLKMVTPEDVHYISVGAPGPASNRVPSRFLEDPPPPPNAGDSLWDEIVSWLPLP